MFGYLSAIERSYRYEGKVYSEYDLSEELDEKYGGDLFALHWKLEHDQGKISEREVYLASVGDSDEKEFETLEEVLEYYADDLGLEKLSQEDIKKMQEKVR